MDIEKFLNLGTDYLSEYLSIVITTLRKPSLRFQPMLESSVEPGAIVLPSKTLVTRAGPRLNPKLFSFMIISIFIGSIVNAHIPNRTTAPEFHVTVVITLAMWFVYSCIVYSICWLLHGKGTFADTLSVSMQLLAVIYLISSLVAFSWGVLVQVPLLGVYLASIGSGIEFLVNNPIYIYFFVQFILFAIYLPLALKDVHGFKWLQQILTLILAIFAILLSLGCYITAGILLKEITLRFTPTPTSIPTPVITGTPTPSPTSTLTSTPSPTLMPSPAFTPIPMPRLPTPTPTPRPPTLTFTPTSTSTPTWPP